MNSTIQHSQFIDSIDEVLVDVLLSDHHEALNATTPFETNDEYMRLIELKYVLKNLVEHTLSQLYQGFSKSGSISNRIGNDIAVVKCFELDLKGLVTRKRKMEALYSSICSVIDTRLKSTENISGSKGHHFIPYIVQLCNKYELTIQESSLFHLMVVVQGSSNPHVTNTLMEEDYLKRCSAFQRICNLSEANVESFCELDRPHLREGVVTCEEDHGLFFNLRVCRTCVQILYGQKVSSDDLLKVSQTTLETIILQSCASTVRLSTTTTGAGVGAVESGPSISLSVATNSHHMLVHDRNVAVDSLLEKRSAAQHDLDNDNVILEGSTGRNSRKRPRRAGGGGASKSRDVTSKRQSSDTQINHIEAHSGTDASSDDGGSDLGDIDDMDEDAGDSDGAHNNGNGGDGGGDRGLLADSSAVTEDLTMPEDDSKLKPYPCGNQLEYLEDGFQIIAVMIRSNAAKLKDDMRKEGTKLNSWESGVGDVKGGRREHQARIRLLENRMLRRLHLTRDALKSSVAIVDSTHMDGYSDPKCFASAPSDDGLYDMPRVEQLATRFCLDEFEKKLLLLLVGKVVSPIVKTLIDQLEPGRQMDDVISVGQALAILCSNFATQISSRCYFYKGSRLLRNGIISLSKPRWHQGSGDLTDQRCIIDRRVLDWVVGLDSEINELVEGSDLYEPKVTLSQLVLPFEKIFPVIKQCRAYDSFRKYRVANRLDDAMSYGNGLVIMLCGKSGTGKTMTVNAIANDLKKKVLLVDFGGLSGKRSDGSGELDADLRGLFREANMSNAILFFDECDAVFKARNFGGGDRLLNALLTEIEKHEGIVFMATNRPQEIDEAMHRRITSVVFYDNPNYDMRLQIWERILGAKVANEGGGYESARFNLSNDVDLTTLAVKFELSGGFIKNALLSGLLSAIHRENKRTKANPSSSDFCPMLCQSDLEEGCKMQMRGFLSVKYSDSNSASNLNTKSLVLSDALKSSVADIIAVETARELVYGAWGGAGAAEALVGSAGGNPNPTPALLNDNFPEFHSISSNTHRSSSNATVVVFAGSCGNGKKTLLHALAKDLERSVQIIHISSIVQMEGTSSSSSQDSVVLLDHILQDAKLANAVVGIDGFESMFDLGVVGNNMNSMKLHCVLSRLLTVLKSYNGLIVLLCNISDVSSIVVQPNFMHFVYLFIKFSTPSYKERMLLWKALMPQKAPVASDVNFASLAKNYDFCSGHIQHVVSKALSLVAYKIISRKKVLSEQQRSDDSKQIIALSHNDLVAAADAEVIKMKGGNISFDTMSKMFM